MPAILRIRSVRTRKMWILVLWSTLLDNRRQIFTLEYCTSLRLWAHRKQDFLGWLVVDWSGHRVVDELIVGVESSWVRRLFVWGCVGGCGHQPSQSSVLLISDFLGWNTVIHDHGCNDRDRWPNDAGSLGNRSYESNVVYKWYEVYHGCFSFLWS